MTQTSVWSATTAERKATSPKTALKESAREILNAVTAKRKATLPVTAPRDLKRRSWNATNATKSDTLPVNAPVFQVLYRLNSSQVIYISGICLYIMVINQGMGGKEGNNSEPMGDMMIGKIYCI